MGAIANLKVCKSAHGFFMNINFTYVTLFQIITRTNHQILASIRANRQQVVPNAEYDNENTGFLTIGCNQGR